MQLYMSKQDIGNENNLRNVKVKGNTGDKDMFPKFLLFREVRLRLERVRSTMLTRSQRGPPISPHALTDVRCRDPLQGGLEGGNQTFTNKVGANSKT